MGLITVKYKYEIGEELVFLLFFLLFEGNEP